MGNYFAGLLKGTIKMGDSPSVGWLLRGNPADPSANGWGGRFVRVWDGRNTRFERLTTEADAVEVFGVVEFFLPLPDGFEAKHQAKMLFDGRIPAMGWVDGKSLCFRFSPRDAKVWTYVIESNFAGLDGKRGSFAAVAPPGDRSQRPSSSHPNWWTDDPDPALAEGVHSGAKTVSRYRLEYLKDFASRMDRCVSPAGP